MAQGYQVALVEDVTTGDGAAKDWPGGRGYFMAQATWGGGSAKLQHQNPLGTWVDVASVSLTDDGSVAFDIPAGKIRAVVATATAAHAWAVR